MINLIRERNNRWIMQKNLSSKELIELYLDALRSFDRYNPQRILNELQNTGGYQGRSQNGSTSTIGVRLSEMSFYMFGHKENDSFIPTQMTLNIFAGQSIEKNMLVNLFSMQFPHPFSNTPENIRILAGRLITKLLLDIRIEKKLYIDEIMYFIPFLESIDEVLYEQLIESILEFRNLNFEDKLLLIYRVQDYEYIFANVLHEFNYYFLRIFEQFNVFKMNIDRQHNDGNLFRFKHGNGDTFRNDAIKSRSNFTGYVTFNETIINDAEILINNFSPFEEPFLRDTFDVDRASWTSEIYELRPIKYLSAILPEHDLQREVLEIINNMVYMSRYSGVDGRDFELSLKDLFELFREAINVQVISGAGDTDVLCQMGYLNNDLIYKVNVDGKSRSSANNLNAPRISRHINTNGSDYCIVVAPRFSRGTVLDIRGYNIVTITAEALGEYLSRECLSSDSLDADFTSLDTIIRSNLGTNISNNVFDLVSIRYGYRL